MLELFNISDSSNLPKYKQIILSITNAIEQGLLHRGDKVPSINDIANKFELSRDTVMAAYNELKAKRIIEAQAGKGYYISSTRIGFKENIFLLFDELNAFKEVLYNSFIETLNNKANVDIYFHYFNRRIFNSLIENNIDKYTTYVIMPAKFEGTSSVLEQITRGNIYILDQMRPDLSKFPAVYQNFDKDVFDALFTNIDLIKKYHTLIMIYPEGKEPKGQKKGFIRFCEKYKINFEVIKNLENRDIKVGEAYIAISDNHLVELVKQIKSKELSMGVDVGIISYNDSPLKEVVGNGITTISTDFKLMGQTLANLILTKKERRIMNPSSLIVRQSL